MSGSPPNGAHIRDEELHAFIDGELPEGRAALVTAVLQADHALASRAASFDADKAALAAAFQPVAAEPLPAEWLRRIEQASAARPPARRVPRRAALYAMALAASLALVLFAATRHPWQATDSILAQAEAVRTGASAPVLRLAGATLPAPEARDALVARAVGLKVRAPDLARLGWQLAEIDTYAAAAALRYRGTDGHALTLYVRRSAGAPRFDLLKNGSLRTCIWQDEVVGAVMTGDMSAGQMMRVAAAAYSALNL